MIADIRAVLWKEWKELAVRRGGALGGTVSVLILVIILGVAVPLQMGRPWVESGLGLALALWAPLVFATGVVSDSFAGERERHTLETLLASPLSDRAILYGKIGMTIGYAWLLTLAAMLLGWLAVNIVHGHGQWLFFRPAIGLGILIGSLLTATLAAAVGVLVSLRASSIRQAHQTMSIAIMLLLFGPVFGVQLLPVAWRRLIAAHLANLDVTRVLLGALLIVCVLDLVLLASARARFQRARLILD